MLSDVVPNPFLWLSHAQWGLLLGGLVSALAAGALSAGIALFVLRRTLRTQHRLFAAAQAKADETHREQIAAQAEALDVQLAAQAQALEDQLAHQGAAVSAQLRAQAGEASKERELAARAELIALVLELADNPESGEIAGLCRRIAAAIHRWGFELDGADGADLRLELGSWGAHLRGCAWAADGEPALKDDYELDRWFSEACDLMVSAATNFNRRADGVLWDASETAKRLRVHRVPALASLGAYWAELEKLDAERREVW